MRLAGQAKMGYYPTPETVADRIGQALTRGGEGLIRVLDPCCGTGEALVRATEGLGGPLERYGVELDQARARAAKARLTQVLPCDLRDTRISHGAFSLLYLNPPYDFDAPEEGVNAPRVERVFLQAATPYLTARGVLVLLIPEDRLGTVARPLAFRFEARRVFRFPEPEFDRFRQIVFLGVKKPEPFRDEAGEAELQALSRGQLTPPPLPETPKVRYPIPPSPPIRLQFQATTLDPEALKEEAARHGVDTLLLQKLFPPEAASSLQALMPLRRGHLALLLASGHLNNQVVEDRETGARYLVKGTVRKETVRTEEVDEEGTVITEREVLKVQVTALDLQTGNLLRLE